MKISKRDIKLLLFVFGAGLVALVYFLVVSPSQTEIEQLEGEVRTLQQEKSELEALKANQPVYEEEIAQMNADMRTRIAIYPANVKEENTFMYADLIENTSDMVISQVGVAYNNLLVSISPSASVEDYALGAGISLYDRQTTYTFSVSYEDFKKMVEYIQKDSDKRNVEQFAVFYDEATAKLSGSMVINMFSLAGTDKAYQPPEVPDMPLGKDNIFGTAKTPNDANGSATPPAQGE